MDPQGTTCSASPTRLGSSCRSTKHRVWNFTLDAMTQLNRIVSSLCTWCHTSIYSDNHGCHRRMQLMRFNDHRAVWFWTFDEVWCYSGVTRIDNSWCENDIDHNSTEGACIDDDDVLEAILDIRELFPLMMATSQPDTSVMMTRIVSSISKNSWGRSVTWLKRNEDQSMRSISLWLLFWPYHVNAHEVTRRRWRRIIDRLFEWASKQSMTFEDARQVLMQHRLFRNVEYESTILTKVTDSYGCIMNRKNCSVCNWRCRSDLNQFNSHLSRMEHQSV
jgi:hypothetical protein